MTVQQLDQPDITGDAQESGRLVSGQARELGHRFEPRSEQEPAQGKQEKPPEPPSDSAAGRQAPQPKQDSSFFGPSPDEKASYTDPLTKALGLHGGSPLASLVTGLDPYQQYQTGRALYAAWNAFADPNAIGQSVQNVWEQQNALAALARFQLSGGEFNPIYATQQALSPTREGGQQGGQMAGTVLPATANPANLLGGEGIWGALAAFGLPLLAQGVFGPGGFPAEGQDIEDIVKSTGKPRLADPQWYADALWTATSVAALAGGSRYGWLRALAKMHPEVGSHLEDVDSAIARHNAAQASAQTPGNPEGTKDFIARTMAEDPRSGGKVLAPGTPEEKRARRHYVELAGGELMDVTRQQRQEQVAAWKKNLGIETPDELTTGAPWTGDQAKYIKDHVWKQAEMPYDLMYQSAEDRGLTDPRYHAEDIEALNDEQTLTSYVDAVNATDAVLSQVHRGPFQTSQWVSGIRSLLGLNRGTDWALQLWAHKIGDLLHNIDPDFEKMRAAQEGDEEAYQALRPQEKAAVDMVRLVHHGVDRRNSAIDPEWERQPNYFPRVDVQPERASDGIRRGRTQSIIAGQRFRHRSLALDVATDPQTGEARLVGRERYRTVDEANQGIQRQRDEAIRRFTGEGVAGEGFTITRGDPLRTPGEPLEYPNRLDLTEEFKNDDHAQHLREQYDKATTPEEREKALTAIKQYVNFVLPLKDTNWYRANVRSLSRSIRSLHSKQAVQMLQQTQLKTKAGIIKRAAYDLSGLEQRQREELVNLGFRTAAAPGYDRVLWHPDVAEWIDRATGKPSALADAPVLRDLLRLERAMVKLVMYFPTVHGMNMAGRMGSYWMSRLLTTDPLGATTALLRGGGARTQLGIAFPVTTVPDVVKHGGRHWYGVDREQTQRRLEAFNAGVIAPSRASRFGSEYAASLAEMTGDMRWLDETVARERPSGTSPAARLVKAGKVVNAWRNHQNELFWSLINDWMVSVYEIEKEQALRTMGLDPNRLQAARDELKTARTALEDRPSDEAAARLQNLQREVVEHEAAHRNASLWAARRANTWGGHVLPEDWNPILHDAARLLFFAPNWWRTFIELLVPLYHRAGFDMTPAMARVIAEHEVRTLFGMVLWQKVSGNVLNIATSGHPQWQNQPGAQDQIELTQPWTDHLPMAVGVPRVDPKTGARRTWENPVARQQRDAEMALGLEAPHPPADSTEQYLADLQEGGAHAFANRLSPMIDLLAGAANIDLHRSLQQRQIVHLDPTTNALSPEALIATLLQAAPGGSDILFQLQQAQEQSATVSPDGTSTPPGVQAFVKGLPKSAMHTLIGWVLGVNPPFDYAVKTRGESPTDQQYRDARLEQDAYEKQMNEQSAKAMSGEIPAYQWRTWYHDRSLQHATTMRGVYKNSPEYVNGTMGMVSQWESLYDQATDPSTGQLDQDRLAYLQGQFRSSHSQSDLDAMDRELSKNDSKYPMLKLYHRTLKAYDHWSQQWAADHGRDYVKIQGEESQYGALQSQRDRDRYLATHPDLRAYREARTREFERTPAGLMYGLFYRSTAVQAYMQQHHLTQEQVEQQAMASEEGAA